MMVELRQYQSQSLDALVEFLRSAGRAEPRVAFYQVTNRPYSSVPGLEDVPYVCLRVPTGGGKTLLAGSAVGIAAREYLQAERIACIWLVPSNAIREQTLAALRDRRHAYRRILDADFGGQVSVMDVTDALYVSRSTLAGETCIILSTLQALRRDDTEGLKVYETNGALQPHFQGLTAEQEALIERNSDGTVPYSLMNLLRLHRPLVIIDEAHNARTALSFETLTRFKPSCIIEFTATPELKHDPAKGEYASNILHHVSAAQLKAEQMIKLPVKLQTKPQWNEAVAEALSLRQRLTEAAMEEECRTGEYIRPLVLFQAQPHSSTKQTITADVLKQHLIENHSVPESEIAVVTGSSKELQGVDLFARACAIKYIITQKALQEGWDCSFAYVLCSVADIKSARSIEQILGRILRLPRVQWKTAAELNCAYAIVTSDDFHHTAMSLCDGLVANGFERIEAGQFVTAQEPRQGELFGAGGLFQELAEPVEEAPDLSKLPKELRQRIEFDGRTSTLYVAGPFPLSASDRDFLLPCFRTDKGRAAVQRIYRRSQGQSTDEPATPSAREMRVPALAIRIGDELELFEETCFLETAWKLTECNAELTEEDFPSEYVSGRAGQLDVTAEGKITLDTVDQVRRQLQLAGVEPGWDLPGLVNWLDRQIPHQDITRTEATLFIHRALSRLMISRGLTIDHLARQKYRLRDVLADKINGWRQEQRKKAFNRVMFGGDAYEVEVGAEFAFHLSEDLYAPHRYDEGRYNWKRHLFRTVGAFDSDEEHECAVHIDQHERVAHWIRNLERSPHAFWLPTSTTRFYPDFLVLLMDGRYLVVEYKGKHLFAGADEKRAVGGLWENRSRGRCLFCMPTDKNWATIDTKIRAA